MTQARMLSDEEIEMLPPKEKAEHLMIRETFGLIHNIDDVKMKQISEVMLALRNKQLELEEKHNELKLSVETKFDEQNVKIERIHSEVLKVHAMRNILDHRNKLIINRKFKEELTEYQVNNKQMFDKKDIPRIATRLCHKYYKDLIGKEPTVSKRGVLVQGKDITFQDMYNLMDKHQMLGFIDTIENDIEEFMGKWKRDKSLEFRKNI